MKVYTPEAGLLLSRMRVEDNISINNKIDEIVKKVSKNYTPNLIIISYDSGYLQFEVRCILDCTAKIDYDFSKS